MKVEEMLHKGLVLYDGSTGVMMQDYGIKGEASESWNVLHPDVVLQINSMYVGAGSDLILANTFTSNRISLGAHGQGSSAREFAYAGMKIALEAAGEKATAVGDIGSTGAFMQPSGDMNLEEAVSVFAEQASAIWDAGAQVIQMETFSDLAELRAAILAVRENTQADMLVTGTFGENGRTLMGNLPECIAIVAQSLGAKAVGANCSGGPETLLGPISRMREVTDLPLIAKPNAGLPQQIDGKNVFPMTPEELAASAPRFVEMGVRLMGGCCGTKPAHIQALGQTLRELSPAPLGKGGEFVCSARSYISAEEAAEAPCVTVSLEDVYDAVDCILDEAAGEPVLLQVEGCLGREEMASFMAELTAAISVPMGFAAEDDTCLENLLRAYTGRAFVKVKNEKQREIALYYGAFLLEQE